MTFPETSTQEVSDGPGAGAAGATGGSPSDTNTNSNAGTTAVAVVDDGANDNKETKNVTIAKKRIDMLTEDDIAEQHMNDLDAMLLKRNEELRMAAQIGTELLATIESQAAKLQMMESSFKDEQTSFAVYKEERKKLMKENAKLKLITTEIENELNQSKKDLEEFKVQMENEREVARRSAMAAEAISNAQISSLKKNVDELNHETKGLVEANNRLSTSLKAERETIMEMRKESESRINKLKELEATLLEYKKREEAKAKEHELATSAVLQEMQEYAARIEEITKEFEALKDEHEEQNRLLSGLQAENATLRTVFDDNNYYVQTGATEIVEKAPVPPYEMLPASVTLVTVLNLFNAVGLVVAVASSFIMHSLNASVPLFGVFLICCSMLWLMFELRTNGMEKWAQTRVGFMYKPGGRGFAIGLLGLLVLSYGKIGVVVAICTLFNAIANVLVLTQYPDLEKQYLFEATTFVELKEKARERVFTKAKDLSLLDVEAQRANLL